MEWEEVELHQVAELSRTSVKPENIKTGEKYLGLDALDANGNCSPVNAIAGDIKSNKFIFTENHILFGKLRPYLRKIVIPDFEGICSTDIIPILPDSSKIEQSYLYHFLRTDAMVKLATSRCSGANLPRISPKQISIFKIPLPPLPIQKKIAAILDAADNYRQMTKALIEKYDQLTQSIFLDMFGDPVRNEKGWELGTIEEIVTNDKYSIKRGPFGGALKKEIFVDDGCLVYEQYHALNNDFSFARYYITDEKYSELKAFDVKPGDIIISCSGVYLGKLAIVPDGAKKGIINQALLKITLDQSKMVNEFFLIHFTQPQFKNKYFKSNRGAGVPNFPPMKEFKKFNFIVPPIELQRKFLCRIQKVNHEKGNVQKQVDKSEQLFQSLLQRAFKGELVK